MKSPTVKIIPLINGNGLGNLIDSEAWMNKLLKKILPEISNRTFVDCGVNIGQTLIKVKNINPTINYIGFEPNIICVYYTKQLIERNKLVETIILPFGISDQNQILNLLTNENSEIDSSASMVSDFRVGNFRSIPCLFLDPNDINYWETHTIGVLKIDVEGGELEVLSGFKSLIKRDTPIIICEILPCYTIDNEFRLGRQQVLLNLLKSLNYKLYRIHKNTIKLEFLEDIEIHSSLDRSDYIFLHRDANVSHMFEIMKAEIL